MRYNNNFDLKIDAMRLRRKSGLNDINKCNQILSKCESYEEALEIAKEEAKVCSCNQKSDMGTKPECKQTNENVKKAEEKDANTNQSDKKADVSRSYEKTISFNNINGHIDGSRIERCTENGKIVKEEKSTYDSSKGCWVPQEGINRLAETANDNNKGFLVHQRLNPFRENGSLANILYDLFGGDFYF